MDERAIKVFGYRFSVYTRVVRLVLAEKGLPCEYVETDPFSADLPKKYNRLHPFLRVPVLVHGEFTLYETAAIIKYLDTVFTASALTPVTPEAAARMNQVIGIVDAYGYRAMVRQVFSHLVFRPLEGLAPSTEEISQGLHESKRVLQALEAIAQEGLVLDGGIVTLADFYLAPMMDYFTRSTEGATMLGKYPALARWWQKIVVRPSLRETRPDLSKVRAVQ